MSLLYYITTAGVEEGRLSENWEFNLREQKVNYQEFLGLKAIIFLCYEQHNLSAALVMGMWEFPSYDYYLQAMLLWSNLYVSLGAQLQKLF